MSTPFSASVVEGPAEGYVFLRIDGSIDIPEVIDDSCFPQNVEHSSSTDHLKIVIFIDSPADEDNNYNICRKALESVARSKYIQIYAKEMRYLELSRFWLDDWKPFLEIFQSGLKSLSLESCHLTDEGARSLGWALEKNNNGLQLEELNLVSLRGSDQWISGLLKGTTVKTIKTMQLDCGFAFLHFLTQCCLRTFDLIEYHGYLEQESNEEDFSPYEVGIRFCPDNQKKLLFWGPRRFSVSLDMHYTWGRLILGFDNRDYRQEQPQPNRMQTRTVDFWKNFQNVLTFQQDQPKEIKISIRRKFTMWLRDFDLLLRAIMMDTSYNAPITEIKLSTSTLSEQASSSLGWLLDTDTSGVNVENLIMESLEGITTALAVGLYKNKTIKNLNLKGLVFWHSALHFIRIARAEKLESVTLYDLSEESDSQPLGVARDEIITASATCNNAVAVSSLERFVCGHEILRNGGRVQLSRQLCFSLGSILRSTELQYLEFDGVQANPDYDFVKDAVLCREICLRDTDFEPPRMASLINNGGRLKRLCLDWSEIRWDKLVVFFKQTDLTLLDEFNAGGRIALEDVLALQQLFVQNKGPRKLTLPLTTFILNSEGNWNEMEGKLTDKELEELGKSLSGNTRIEQIKLIAPLTGSYEPSVMLKLLHLLCTMPSLNHLEIYSEKVWGRDNRVFDGHKECQRFIINQLWEKNRLIDASTWVKGGEDFAAMIKMFRKCKLLLSHYTNDFPDGLWAHVFARTKGNLNGVLFRLLRELPRLLQQAGNKTAKDEERPRFIVPHHPDCPGCHKRRKL